MQRSFIGEVRSIVMSLDKYTSSTPVLARPLVEHQVGPEITKKNRDRRQTL
jgi:hypothetical protein